MASNLRQWPWISDLRGNCVYLTARERCQNGNNFTSNQTQWSHKTILGVLTIKCGCSGAARCRSMLFLGLFSRVQQPQMFLALRSRIMLTIEKSNDFYIPLFAAWEMKRREVESCQTPVNLEARIRGLQWQVLFWSTFSHLKERALATAYAFNLYGTPSGERIVAIRRHPGEHKLIFLIMWRIYVTPTFLTALVLFPSRSARQTRGRAWTNGRRKQEYGQMERPFARTNEKSIVRGVQWHTRCIQGLP